MHKPASNIATDDLVDSRNFTFAHTGSYYAATQRPTTDFAKLEGAKTADVCVIGAGFSGISTALHLAERGYNVHVVEANKVGWGASGRNGGWCMGLAELAHAVGRRNIEQASCVFIDNGDIVQSVTGFKTQQGIGQGAVEYRRIAAVVTGAEVTVELQQFA